MGRKAWLVLVIVAVMLAPLSGSLAQKAELQYVDKDALKGMLGDPKVLIIDVRAPSDWDKADKMIKGAVRQAPDKTATWSKTLPKDKQIILYCA